MKPDDIRALRRAFGENTTTFGARFARSGRAVEDWEQGRRAPDALVVRALEALQARIARRRKVTTDSAG